MSAVPALPAPLPALDNTLGALYIGACLLTLLYGVICVQTFLYITSNRARSDRWWLKLLVFVIVNITQLIGSGLDTVSHGIILAGMYRYLVSDFANPAALKEGGAVSGTLLVTYASLTVYTVSTYDTNVTIGGVCRRGLLCTSHAALLLLAHMEVQRFFAEFMDANRLYGYHASYVAMGIFGSQHHLHTPNAPEFSLATELSASSGTAFDVIMTLVMITSLHRARSGITKSDHTITFLTLFTVNTNLITTLLSVGSLVTFLVLPDATVYGGISFLIPKSYLNSFLAIDYLREKLDPSMSIHEAQPSHPVFAVFTSTNATTARQMEELELESAHANDSSTKV
ncbi:uncharacterized protein EV420DRAFT_1634585 [Desarmillaria tabescens]|uniref:DUF6534 domain-containing protein n=1 Tax=Armillaria tabescens TaxID=1929756 RepID=A0AA39NQU3_ARMTA|nr:uncharacterized protein EV420DRAFT_1634585 [Desarmillaria tabescens]KAK0470169.1 hypothetical protein EV420DRAFT_1634585 [Desarmillaria tabescens]